MIDLVSSDSSSSSSDDDNETCENGSKRRRVENVAIPLHFLDPLPIVPVVKKCKQFWKAGDYEGSSGGDWITYSDGMDRVRVHPKFLHSNATSHKWVLGAFAELLDNSLDEVYNGATFAKIDVLTNHKDGNKMLLVEDNGGGMDPEKMRHCMSLGYSAKSKIDNTIGQYGNGFKTSTMRLGADVIVFSRCCGKDGNRPTQCIGLLSYTFLRSTGKEDIVVPMLDYEREGKNWKGFIRTSENDWKTNLDTIVQWSPFSSEYELLRQFTQMKDQGTRIFIYNLWEDDEGQLELDFDADPNDIQSRGVNRDEKDIQMAKQYPNSKHFLTYRHSLRVFNLSISILYLRIPPGFRIILRGKDVEHHNIVNDMMMSENKTYRPNSGNDGVAKESDMIAAVTVGFVKDAKYHIDVQGFNVYHKNRLIKPFWRIWNANGSNGRGVIGVLEANFVEPAHDKQGFERTVVLSRLETKLLQMQRTYWRNHCHKIGYAACRDKEQISNRGSSPECSPRPKSQAKTQNTRSSTKTSSPPFENLNSFPIRRMRRLEVEKDATTFKESQMDVTRTRSKSVRDLYSEPTSHSMGDNNEETPMPVRSGKSAAPASKSSEKNGNHSNMSSQNIVYKEAKQNCASNGKTVRNSPCAQSMASDAGENQLSSPCSYPLTLDQLKEENRQLRERLDKKEEEVLSDFSRDLKHEKEKSESLKSRLDEATQKIEELHKEQESLLDIFTEERQRRDLEEETLRKKLKESLDTIQTLQDKVKLLEKRNIPSKLRS